MTTVILIAVACILVAGLFAVIVERTNERDEALTNYATEVFANARLRARLAELEAEADELNQENMALHLQLTEAQIAAGALESLPSLPSLRLVPPQRDGSEYEWPALAREIQTDDLTTLMRAVEES